MAVIVEDESAGGPCWAPQSPAFFRLGLARRISFLDVLQCEGVQGFLAEEEAFVVVVTHGYGSKPQS